MADSQLDSVGGITLGAFEAIQAINRNVIAWKDHRPFVWLGLCPRQMSLNHTIEPWNSPDMRRAFSLMIDRQQLVEIAYEGTSIPSKTIFVEYAGIESYINTIKNLWIDPTANVRSGQRLIEESGWRINANGFYQQNEALLSGQSLEASNSVGISLGDADGDGDYPNMTILSSESLKPKPHNLPASPWHGNRNRIRQWECWHTQQRW